MRCRICHVIVTVLAAACLPRPCPAAPADEESRLLAVLRSAGPPAAKEAACVRLKQIGTARSAAVLGELLADEELSHMARHALESMPSPQAGAALLAALGKTRGRVKAGIIDSLGDRRERRAADALAALLGDADAMVAASAATALGKIGGPQAVRALKAVAARPEVLDALLVCADRMRTTEAAALYRQLYESKSPPHVRAAAYRGMILTAGDRAVALVVAAIQGPDRPAVLAAMPLVRRIAPGSAATKTFAGLLTGLAPPRQAALIEALAQRGDTAAAGAIASAATSRHLAVRIAAVDAMGVLGDASAVAVLARAATSSIPHERKAARRALGMLRRGDVREAILAKLANAEPAMQAELARALAARGDTGAAATLLKMAARGEMPVRLAAARAVAMLADESAVNELTDLLVNAEDQPLRDALQAALIAVCGRSKRREDLLEPILAAGKGKPTGARCALLHVAARIGGPTAMRALRAAVRDEEPAVREAAIRSMAETAGIEAAGDLLAVAREAKDPRLQVPALRGYCRLIGLATGEPDKRLKMCRDALAACRRPDEKKLVLAELAKLATPDALALARSLTADKSIRPEAEAAGAQIAAAVEKHAGYVTEWSVAGPYRLPGKQCRQLFDIPLGPERPGEKVAWRALAPPADAESPRQADLSALVGGDHCVMYLRSYVLCPAEQPVRLDIGTDDGVKLWINGKLVHANNAIRGLQPGQDRACATLQKGPNEFLLKITQHTQGCGACVRIRRPDGPPVEDLRFRGARPH